MRDGIIRTIIVEPGKSPCIAYLYASIAVLDKAVSIGADYPCHAKAKKLENHIYILYAKESNLLEFKVNRHVGKDIVAGVFYVIATDEQTMPISLTDAEVKTYMKQFATPEIFPEEEELTAFFQNFHHAIFENEK